MNRLWEATANYSDKMLEKLYPKNSGIEAVDALIIFQLYSLI
jgi:hypothetical protein